MRDIILTSLETIDAFEVVSGEYLWTLDELETVSIAQGQEETEITGRRGRKISSLKRNKSVTISGSNGLISEGLFQTQTGSKFINKAKQIMWADYIKVGEGGTFTKYTAVGTRGAEITSLYVKNSNGEIERALVQSDVAASGTFTYNSETKALGFYSDVPVGTDIVAYYYRNVSANVLHNYSDSYSQKCSIYINALGEDKCGETYRVQIYIPKADFSGSVEFDIGGDQTVHNFELEALGGACGSHGEFFTFTVFDTKAEFIQVGEGVIATFKNGVLTLNGTGVVEPYSSSSSLKSIAADITSIVVGDGVDIGTQAFMDLYALRSVTFTGRSNVATQAFDRCESIAKITLTPDVVLLGERIFGRCEGLRTMVYPDGISIAGGLSYCPNLVDVSIPQSATSLTIGAFRGCESLTEISLPDGLTEIPKFAFSGCKGLTSISIPESVASIGLSAFDGCTSLTALSVPEGVTEIPSSMCGGCEGLTSVTIPASVTNIRDAAFYGCTGLTEISLPEGITEIPLSMCSECRGLTSITIPAGVTKIRSYSFQNCVSLTELVLPAGIIEIESNAFKGCVGLTSITLPSSIRTVGGFSGCKGLTSITIPNGATSIGSSAFSDCTGLTTITIPNSVTTIGGSAFSGCTGLASIAIPNSVTSITAGAFSKCTGLVSVILPSGINTINPNLFGNCTNLKTVILPSSVSTFNGAALNGCSSLENIDATAVQQVPTLAKSGSVTPFNGCPETWTITAPASLYDSWVADSKWAPFASHIVSA